MIEDIPVIYVDTAAVLEVCVTRLSVANIIAVDTEFIRVSTFFPKLALLQIFDGKEIYLIDAPAISKNLRSSDPEFIQLWSGLIDVFNSASIIKVFHACEEDLELLHYYYGVMPQSIFDTQLACGFVGLDYPMGYQKLVAELCDAHVEKGDSRSNWLQRPLIPSQLSYAAYDVVYLLTIWRLLCEKLVASGHLLKFQADCDAMVSALNRVDYSSAYLKVKQHAKLSARPLARLQALAQWREEVMRLADLPRNKVATNDALMLLARKGVEANTWLFKVEGLSAAVVKHHKTSLESVLAATPDQSELAYFVSRVSLDAKYLKQREKKFKLLLIEQAQQVSIFEQILIKKLWLEAVVLQAELLGDFSKSELFVERLLSGNWRQSHYVAALKAMGRGK